MREHSRKPDDFYAMVDSLCHGRKLDYFSREKREGWEQFGNDIKRFAA
jgi:N6-adenosine-specific RNA methylase IME4